jgi:hypothetical protein
MCTCMHHLTLQRTSRQLGSVAGRPACVLVDGYQPCVLLQTLTDCINLPCSLFIIWCTTLACSLLVTRSLWCSYNIPYSEEVYNATGYGRARVSRVVLTTCNEQLMLLPPCHTCNPVRKSPLCVIVRADVYGG